MSRHHQGKPKQLRGLEFSIYLHLLPGNKLQLFYLLNDEWTGSPFRRKASLFIGLKYIL
jgi:hypothetical protein